MKVITKRTQAALIAGLILFALILPQFVMADILPGSISVTDITETSAEIAWTTNTTSDSRVNYGITPALGETQYDAADVNNHNIVLTGLTQDTTYYFEVISDGERSPANPIEYYTFKTLAPATYSITLNPTCGVCGDLVDVGVCGEVVEVTAAVPAAGTYYICWRSRAAWNPDNATGKVEEFTASGPGIYHRTFFMPEAYMGEHSVYLTDNAYNQKGDPATFKVSPSVKIDLEEGPVGTEVTLDGYGFPASKQIKVTLFQGEINKGEDQSDTADAKGTWGPISYTIPDNPAGRYTLNIAANEGSPVGWVTWVRKDFEVTPEIIVPESGTVGQTIEISGTGFASEEKDIEITFDGDVVETNNPIVADVDGSWQTTLIIPSIQRGIYTVDASGKYTRARDVPDVELIVGAGVRVEPSMAYVGDTIIVTGGGFAPEETGVKVTFDGSTVATNIPVDSDGHWETSFDLQTSAYGSHTVSASGDTTAAVTTTLSTKAQITALSPDEGSPGDSITLTGNGFHGSQALTVTIGGVAASGNLQTQSNGNFNISFRVPKGSSAGERTLVVTDADGATDSIDFTVTEKILSTTPLPISPMGSTLRSGEVTFKWQGETGSTTYTYKIEINTTAGPGNIWSKSSITESSYTLLESEVLPRDTYYWRVKVVDDYGNEGPWSDYVEFKVSPIQTWVWVVIGAVVLVVLMVVAYRETKFRVTE